jgi:hypothetical protein
MSVIDDLELEEMVSYRKNVTGVDHTLFISPRGNARHGPRVKVAIDPPDSLDPRSVTATVALDGILVAGDIAPELLRQVQRFIELNHQALLDYWDYRIDTDQLRQRLQK